MGGARVLSYLAAWILIPAEGEPNSMAGVPVRVAESAVTALVRAVLAAGTAVRRLKKS
jgi:chemotaxis receptor (MCP) glutamine deamidase CheD